MKLLTSIVVLVASSTAFGFEGAVIDTSAQTKKAKTSQVQSEDAHSDPALAIINAPQRTGDASDATSGTREKKSTPKSQSRTIAICSVPLNFEMAGKNGVYEYGTLSISVVESEAGKRLVTRGILTSDSIAIREISSQFGRLTVVTDGSVEVSLPDEEVSFEAHLNGFELEASSNNPGAQNDVSVSALVSAEKNSSQFRRMKWSHCKVSREAVASLEN